MTDSFYDRVDRWSSVDLPRTRAAFALAASVGASKILDVGSDRGENSAALAIATKATVVCMDISEAAVMACRERGLEAHRGAIGEAPLPFDDNSFDVVHMAEVIEHLPHPDRAMDEVRRILRPHGHLVISTPNLACLPNRFLLPLGLQPIFTEVSEDQVLGRGLHLFGQGSKPVGHLRIYSKRGLLEFVQLSGFRIVRLKGVPLHTEGIISRLEQLASLWSSTAMDLVLLAQKLD
jgi:2-polyprenyl-3-methyl-5-hydroxy-6-metoxy-1,4-benzoquinol methylase